MQNVNILTLLNICHKYIFSLYFKIPLTKQHAFLSRTYVHCKAIGYLTCPLF